MVSVMVIMLSKNEISKLETVTTIRKEYIIGEIPMVEVPVPVITGEDMV